LVHDLPHQGEKNTKKLGGRRTTFTFTSRASKGQKGAKQKLYKQQGKLGINSRMNQVKKGNAGSSLIKNEKIFRKISQKKGQKLHARTGPTPP